MEKRYKKTKFDPIALCFIANIMCVFFVSVGFSAFQNVADIQDIAAVVRMQADIRITNASINIVTGGAVSNYEDYNVRNVTSSVSLPNSNSPGFSTRTISITLNTNQNNA